MKKNNGGPAFPRSGFGMSAGTESFCNTSPNVGMTLRDWFAGQALNGICADPQYTPEPEEYGSLAYEIADVMIAERDKEEA